MFETFAVLSTLACITILVLLYQMDRRGRQEDAASDDASPDQQR
jgi:hypothetical protein